MHKEMSTITAISDIGKKRSASDIPLNFRNITWEPFLMATT